MRDGNKASAWIGVGVAATLVGMLGVAAGVLWLAVFSGEACSEFRRVPLGRGGSMSLAAGAHDVALEYDGATAGTGRDYEGKLLFGITGPAGQAVPFDSSFSGTYRTCASGTWIGSFVAPTPGLYLVAVQPKPGIQVSGPVIVAVKTSRPSSELAMQIGVIAFSGLLALVGPIPALLAMRRRKRARGHRA